MKKLLFIIVFVLSATSLPLLANALHFDGVDDYVEVPDSDELSLTGDLTIEALINVVDFANYRAILGKTDSNIPAGYDYYLETTTGKPIFYVGNGTVHDHSTATNPVTTGTWLHIAVTKSGNTVTHYLEGVINGSSTVSTTIADGDKPLRIGSRDDLFPLMYGTMDEVRIWNYARSQTEINSNKHSKLLGTELGLVAYYQFDEGVPNGDNTTPPIDTLPDKTSNGNDGMLNNFALIGTSSNWVDSATYLSTNILPVIPDDFTILQAYPNPFNPVTTISYQLPAMETVNISIYNIAGQLTDVLVNEVQMPGEHSITWRADQNPSGMYLVRMTSNGTTAVKKIQLIK